jgi:hypothetical protein
MFLGHYGLAMGAKRGLDSGCGLLLIFLGNAFGPPPPNEQALALFGLAGVAGGAMGVLGRRPQDREGSGLHPFQLVRVHHGAIRIR